MITRRAHSDGDRDRDDGGCETAINATMTASLPQAVMPAQYLALVAIFQWPLAWAIICLLLAVDLVWASQVGLTMGGGEIKAGLIGALLALSVAFRRRDRGIAKLFEAIALYLVSAAAGSTLMYLAASCAFPLQDAMMERLDRAIGFDWLAWRQALLDQPILSGLLVVAYNSMFPQLVLLLFCFSPTGRSARIGELLLLAGATMVPTALISAIWPTLGPFAVHGVGDVTYLRDLLALRASGPWHSYHTVMAVLLTYAFRRTGLVGYGIATLNLVMLLSIPPIGGHYLVDVLAGGALGLGAIAVQRATRHAMNRNLFGLWRETLFGRSSIWSAVPFKPARISAQTLAVKSGRLHDARDET